MRRLLYTLASLGLGLALAPVTAGATGALLLGFAEPYTGPSGAVSIHRGVDVALEAGSAVCAPCAGEIGFVGRVPGSDGGTVLAVTILEADRKISLLPLAEASVRPGDRVEAGSAIGRLAGSGDPSSDRPHLHVGLRHRDVYVDPSELLAPAITSSDPVAEPVPQGGVDPVSEVPGSSTQAVVAEGAEAVAGISQGVQVAPTESAAAQGQAGASTAPQTGDSISVARVAPGVTLGPDAAPDPATGPVTAPVAPSPTRSATGANDALHVGRLIGSVASAVASIAHQPLGIGACLAAVLGCASVLTRRALARRLVSEEPMSDRLGSMLRALRAGDTICGLTSCSGHSAFTDPGPL